MHRTLALFSSVAIALIASPSTASAQGGDVTFFLGAAYPVYDERMTLRAPVPSLPGVDVSVAGTPEIKADGGLVFGGAAAFELGVFGIEGRLDATDIGFDLKGARYTLRGNAPPFDGVRASVTIADGRADADRLYLVSLNARLRTPGSVGFVASGGLSYLPDITITGSVPVTAEIAGFPVLGNASLRLTAAPGEDKHRWGVNGGAGIRIGAGRVAVMAEVRAFYFREFELRFLVDDAPPILDEFLDDLGPIQFEPVIINAQAGIVLKF